MLEHAIWGSLDLCSRTMVPYIWLKNKFEVPFGYYSLSQPCGPPSSYPIVHHPGIPGSLCLPFPELCDPLGHPRSQIYSFWKSWKYAYPCKESCASQNRTSNSPHPTPPSERTREFSKEVPPSSLSASCLVTKGAWLLLGPQSTIKQALQTQAARSREGFWGLSALASSRAS